MTLFQFESPQLLWSGTSDGTIQCWSMETKRIITSNTPHDGHAVIWLDIHHSSGNLLTQGRNGWVKIWAKEEGLLKELGLSSNMFFKIALQMKTNMITKHYCFLSTPFLS